MQVYKYFTGLCIFLLTYAAHAQHKDFTSKLVTLTDTIPCHLELKLKYKRWDRYISPDYKEYRSWDSINSVQELACDQLYKDGVLCFNAEHITSLCLVLRFYNTGTIDTFNFIPIASIYDSTVIYELYRKEENKLIPDVFYNFNSNITTGIFVPPGGSDSTYSYVNVDEKKLRTGVYAIRGRYIQLCNNKATIKHTNYIYFRVIK